MSTRKGLRSVAIGLAVWTALAGALAHADVVMVPNGLENTDGNSGGQQIPFLISQQIRYQQVYAASEFPGPICITQIAFRPDAAVVSGFTSSIEDIQINLSTTSKAPDGLSGTFADNVGVDDTVVFEGSLTLSSSNTGPDEGPKDFDINISLTTPFSYNPGPGNNLLLDVRKFSEETPTVTNVLDAHSQLGDSISRVLATGEVDAEHVNDFPSTLGLVTQFTFTLGECTGSDSGQRVRAPIDLDPDVFEVAVEPYQTGEAPGGQFLTAFIKPPQGMSAGDIDPDTVILSVNGMALENAASSEIVGNLLAVKFLITPAIISALLGIDVVKVEVDVTKNRIAVIATTEPAPSNDLIKLSVSGLLNSDGGSFRGTDAVRVMPALSSNQPPVADAGADQTVQCTSRSGAKVRLDGSGSSDPDGDPLTFTWTGPFGTLTGKHVKTKLPVGEHTITLTVDDGRRTASDVTVVSVLDSGGPTIKSITASPKVLWPPNHKMVPVTVSAFVSDPCHGTNRCRIYAVSSNERPGHNGPDWKVTGDLTLKLRAERSGKGNGRVYTITVKCKDDTGHSSTKTVTVKVPHDQGKGKEKIHEVKEKVKETVNTIKKNLKH